MNRTKFYLQTMQHLLHADLKVFKERFLGRVIDLFIWVCCVLGVMGYIMPALGLSTDYGNFQLAGSIASVGMFEIFPHTMQMVSDIEGNNTISYQLTLPVPSWLILVKTIIYYAIGSTILSIVMLPLGKLVLWHTFAFSNVSFIRFLIMVISSGILYGAITLLFPAWIKNMAGIGHVWTRCIFPFWFLGGFQFSWATLYGIAPTLAYVDLLNPIIYVMEGFRTALLGQEGNLPFWVCVIALLLMSVGASWWAIVQLKKRLDFV